MTTRPKERDCIVGRRRGFALVMVMWVVALLTIIALSYSALARTETQGTLAFKESVEKRYLAEAGIQRAVLELYYRKMNRDPNLVLEIPDMVRPDGSPQTYEIENGSHNRYTIRITDEAGKIGINTLTDASAIVLNNLLRNAGSTEEEANTIVDSILDWKDADDLHRLHGAENDYYMSLPNPYKARNAKFETLEELMLVKGMTPDILFGSDKRPGIIRFLTVHTTASTINLRFAPREVLIAIPHMTDAMADAILAQRGTEAADTMNQITAILGDAFKDVTAYAGFAPESKTFTIESTGHKAGEKKGFTVTATIALESSNRWKYLYYKSPSGNGQ